MSQHWHAHWVNEAYKPIRLGNWEVPNWHPCWPDRHYTLTTFQSDNRGHILAGQKKSQYSPWGEFKGTWELPRRIDRCCARKLSAPPQHKKDAWAAHKAKNRSLCLAIKAIKEVSTSDTSQQDFNQDSEYSKNEEPEFILPPMHTDEATPKHPCLLHNICQV